MQEFSLAVLVTPTLRYITSELYLQISSVIIEHIHLNLIEDFLALHFCAVALICPCA
jgi:hypothetical protein